MMRLFISVPIPDYIKPLLHEMGRSLPGGRPIPVEQIHVTLRFIGEVEGGMFKDIRESLATVRFSPFTLGIRGVGHFPPRGKPRVIWAGLYPVEELVRLKRKIDTCLVQCGIAPDSRKFSPHVSIARLNNSPLKRVTQFLAGNAFLEFEEFEVDCFELFSSRLSQKGAHHTLEEKFMLLSR